MEKIVCKSCGWTWKLKDGGNDPYICHKCGHNNEKLNLENIMTNESGENQNYMFFSNIKQLKRQCDILLDMDESLVNNILNNGHDWADDHVTVAKENIDQVFDFLMNETKTDDNEPVMNESKKENNNHK